MSNLPTEQPKAQPPAKITIREYISAPAVMQKMQDMLRDEASIRSFTTSVVALASQDKLLMEAEPRSVFNAALNAASMNLPINKNFGYAYVIGYKDNRTGIVEAQFQMGARGFKELAQRSGRYKIIHEGDVRQGELKGRNRLTGEFDWEFVEDDAERNKLPVIGYFSYFKLDNGFENTLYMTVEELEAHAMQYSKAYQYDKRAKKSSSPWSTDFAAMAKKTVMKLNISKNGPLDINLQRAVASDQAVITDDNQFNYIDGETVDLEDEKATEDQFEAIVNAHTEEK